MIILQIKNQSINMLMSSKLKLADSICWEIKVRSGGRGITVSVFLLQRQCKTKTATSARKIVEKRLKRKHSPEQISGILKRHGMQVSHETIYKYIVEDKADGGTLYKELRINGERRYRRRAEAGRVSKIVGWVSWCIFPPNERRGRHRPSSRL